MSKLQNNITSLQSLLEQVNALPEAGGVELPELQNEGSTEDLMLNKELINADGNKITGTFTIDTELSTQDSLIAQIQTALQNKALVPEPVLQAKTITPTTNTQNITPDSGYDGLSEITVTGDTDLVAENIKSGVNIFGVNGTYSPVLQTKTITPTTNTQNVTPDSGYDGLSKVTVNGDTNLIADNIKSGISIFGVDGTYEGSGSGDTSIEDGMIMGTISGNYTNDRVTIIRNSTFAACSALTSVNFPIVTSIGSNAFAWCSNLASISFPEATTIGSFAFTWCSHLTTVDFPAVTSIGNSAFQNCSRLTTINFPIITTVPSFTFQSCSGLTTISFPAATTIGTSAFLGDRNLASVNFPIVTSIGLSAFGFCYKLASISFPEATTISNHAFYNCSGLTTANFPKATTIGSGAFLSCTSLTTTNFPVATTIGNNTFQSCSKLTTANFPKVTTINSGAFQYCTSLTTASFPKATTISSRAFLDCYNLKSLYLTGSSLCKLSNLNAFTSTPIFGYSTSAGTYGSIYVKTSLLTSYKTATNWTVLSSRFVGI